MKIALVGYGKMGQIIDKTASGRGHDIVARLKKMPTAENLNGAEMAIEFSRPDVAFENLKSLLQMRIPTVCGTTGWLDKLSAVENLAMQNNTGFIYGSNFSLGVNLFFDLNQKLAALMQKFDEYLPQMEEIHHTQKKDAPSGTAITLAEDLLQQNKKYSGWQLGSTTENKLGIIAERTENVPGTHIIRYSSPLDEIAISHTAFSREGFALGAVIAAEFLQGKHGVYTMKDVLGL